MVSSASYIVWNILFSAKIQIYLKFIDDNFSMNWITFIRSYGEALTKNHKQNNNYTCTFWSFIQKIKHYGKANTLVIQALNDCIVNNYLLL